MSANITKYKEGSVEQTEFLKKVQQINSVFNREPDKKYITDLDKKFNYLPISHLETILDEYFFGQWSMKNFQYSQICNEIIGSIELVVNHPISGTEITRIGAASIVIMQDSGSKLTDFNNTKKKNALVMGFPKLKAECFKNAVQTLGKAFGRDLNRKIIDSYEPLIKTNNDEKLIEKVMKAVSEYKGEDKEEIKKLCVEKTKSNEFTEAFAKNILDGLKDENL